jgi:hypothetical protein
LARNRLSDLRKKGVVPFPPSVWFAMADRPQDHEANPEDEGGDDDQVEHDLRVSAGLPEWRLDSN